MSPESVSHSPFVIPFFVGRRVEELRMNTAYNTISQFYYNIPLDLLVETEDFSLGFPVVGEEESLSSAGFLSP